MDSLAVALAFAAAFCLAAGLVLTPLGLRHIAPISGAAISIPSSTLMFVALAPFVLGGESVRWSAVAIFAAVGLIYPGAVTLTTFAANRVLGPVITGTLGNFAPLFAVSFALVMLGEPLRSTQLAGLIVIVAGVVVLTWRGAGAARWRSWYLLLPLAAAGLRGLMQPTIKLGLEIWPSPFAASLVGYIVSCAIVLAAARLTTGTLVAPAPPSARLWFSLVGICNGLASLLIYAALANGPVALVSPLVATYPLITVALSALLGQRADGRARLLLAVALTVAGVVLLLAG